MGRMFQFLIWVQFEQQSQPPLWASIEKCFIIVSLRDIGHDGGLTQVR